MLKVSKQPTQAVDRMILLSQSPLSFSHTRYTVLYCTVLLLVCSGNVRYRKHWKRGRSLEKYSRIQPFSEDSLLDNHVSKIVSSEIVIYVYPQKVRSKTMPSKIANSEDFIFLF